MLPIPVNCVLSARLHTDDYRARANTALMDVAFALLILSPSYALVCSLRFGARPAIPQW
ncbi:MAG TPA: hypothetical protein VNO21_27195 [Polyangiaceae bacterium]|nr:hypothetical protein [Polyangiaceae bacterium]